MKQMELITISFRVKNLKNLLMKVNFMNMQKFLQLDKGTLKKSVDENDKK